MLVQVIKQKLNSMKKNDPFYEFTNFFPFKYIYKDKIYKTSEHHFQSLKFSNTEDKNKILEQATPRGAFNKARELSQRIDPKWHGTTCGQGKKHDAMTDALLAKFTSHAALAALLMATDGYDLEEASPYDGYWGTAQNICFTCKKKNQPGGHNFLGKGLMELRAELLAGKHTISTDDSVGITKSTEKALEEMNLWNLYQQNLTSILNGSFNVDKDEDEFESKDNNSNDNDNDNSNQKIRINANYKAPENDKSGWLKHVSESISSYFDESVGYPSVFIGRVSKDMFIKLSSEDEANQVAELLKDKSLECKVNKTKDDTFEVCIHNGNIGKFLSEVLKLKGGFITAFKSVKGVQ